MNLKNQEIPSLDENSQGPQPCIILFPGHRGPIKPVLTPAGAGNCPGELKLRAAAELVNQANEGPPTLLLLLLVVESVDQVLQLSPTELARPYAEDEANCIHEVGLSGTIGANNRREVVEGTDGLEALVGLEVLELQAEDFPRGDHGRHGWLKNPPTQKEKEP